MDAQWLITVNPQITVAFGKPLRFARPQDPAQLKEAQRRFAEDVRRAVVALQAQVVSGKPAAPGVVQRVGPAAKAVFDRCCVLVLHMLAVAMRGLTGMLLGQPVRM